jgi:paired amphipathic helix protein Sin3a
LPPGYSLEPTNNPSEPVHVIYPPDVAAQDRYHPHEERRIPQPSQMAPSHIINSMNPQPLTHSPGPRGNRPVEFNHAIVFVNKIKNRYATSPEIYKQFLEILQAYQKEQKPINEVYSLVQHLFGDAPDLLEEFKQFLPDTSAPAPHPPPKEVTVPPPAPVVAAAPPPPQPKKERVPKRQPPSNLPVNYTGPPPTQNLPPPRKKVKVVANEKPGTLEELEFFEKCKRVIGNKTSYNEFLKVLNLFSQEVIEAKVLIERVEPFLGKAPHLFDWFKRFVKYEESDIICNSF